MGIMSIEINNVRHVRDFPDGTTYEEAYRQVFQDIERRTRDPEPKPVPPPAASTSRSPDKTNNPQTGLPARRDFMRYTREALEQYGRLLDPPVELDRRKKRFSMMDDLIAHMKEHGIPMHDPEQERR